MYRTDVPEGWRAALQQHNVLAVVVVVVAAGEPLVGVGVVGEMMRMLEDAAAVVVVFVVGGTLFVACPKVRRY